LKIQLIEFFKKKWRFSDYKLQTFPIIKLSMLILLF